MSDEDLAQTTRHAFEEDECLLCLPANHPACEMYSTVGMVDRSQIPLGESAEDHLVEVPVCGAHLEALQQYQFAANLEEVKQSHAF